jgi:hypothetical protein
MKINLLRFFIILLLISAPLSVYAAGSAMTFTCVTDGSNMNSSRLVVAWTSDSATGAVEGTFTATEKDFCAGKTLMSVLTIPDAVAAPTNLYDVELHELQAMGDTTGIDILGDTTHPGRDRSATASERISPEITTTTAGTSRNVQGMKNKYYRVKISNAGNSTKGIIELELRR